MESRIVKNTKEPFPNHHKGEVSIIQFLQMTPIRWNGEDPIDFYNFLSGNNQG